MSKKAGTRINESDVQAEVSIIRIPPHHYIHVLDQNTNIARIEIGPLTYIRQDNERSESAGARRFCSGVHLWTIWRVLNTPLLFLSRQSPLLSVSHDHGAPASLLRHPQSGRPGRGRAGPLRPGGTSQAPAR